MTDRGRDEHRLHTASALQGKAPHAETRRLGAQIGIKTRNELLNLTSYILVEHEIWGKVEHPPVDVLVRPPSQGEHHHPHPGLLNDRHLVVHVEISETWGHAFTQRTLIITAAFCMSSLNG